MICQWCPTFHPMSKNNMCNGAERKHGGESDRAVLIPPNETGDQPAIDNTAVGNTDPVAHKLQRIP